MILCGKISVTIYLLICLIQLINIRVDLNIIFAVVVILELECSERILGGI